jgi:uncharacterized membrane protein YbhN (UPF0104 family)
MALRWYFILRAQGLGKPLGEVVGVTFLASTLAPLVPGGLGADLFRGYHFASRYGNALDFAGTIVLDRVVGIGSMLLVASFGALVAWRLGFGADLLASLLVLQAVGFAGWVFLYAFRARAGSIAFRNAALAKGWRGLVGLLRPLFDGGLLRRVLPMGASLSVVVQLLRCLSFWLLYKAFLVDVGYAYFLAFIPLIFLASMLPVSVGGLGVREGTLVFFFGALGVPAEVSFAVGILWYALQIGIGAAIIGVWFVATGLRTLRSQRSAMCRPQR